VSAAQGFGGRAAAPPEGRAAAPSGGLAGVKVYGEGEWKVRRHGYSRRRTWRKLHLAVDEATKEFVAVVVTTNNFKNSQLLEDLLEQVEDEVKQVSADGAYDSRNCYEALRGRGRGRPSRRAKGRASGSTATRKQNATSATSESTPV
jgi:IS5 family transposase